MNNFVRGIMDVFTSIAPAFNWHTTGIVVGIALCIVGMYAIAFAIVWILDRM